MPFLHQHVVFILYELYSVKHLTVSLDLLQPPTFSRLLADRLQMNIYIYALLLLILRLFRFFLCFRAL